LIDCPKKLALLIKEIPIAYLIAFHFYPYLTCIAGHGGNPLPEHRDGLLQQDLLHLLVLISQEHARI
jgi:hypothetical protein